MAEIALIAAYKMTCVDYNYLFACKLIMQIKWRSFESLFHTSTFDPVTQKYL